MVNAFGAQASQSDANRYLQITENAAVVADETVAIDYSAQESNFIESRIISIGTNTITFDPANFGAGSFNKIRRHRVWINSNTEVTTIKFAAGGWRLEGDANVTPPDITIPAEKNITLEFNYTPTAGFGYVRQIGSGSETSVNAEPMPVIDLDGPNNTSVSLGVLQPGFYRYTASSQGWSAAVDGIRVDYSIEDASATVVASARKDYESSHTTGAFMEMPEVVFDFTVTTAQEYTIKATGVTSENVSFKTIAGVRFVTNPQAVSYTGLQRFGEVYFPTDGTIDTTSFTTGLDLSRATGSLRLVLADTSNMRPWPAKDIDLVSLRAAGVGYAEINNTAFIEITLVDAATGEIQLRDVNRQVSLVSAEIIDFAGIGDSGVISTTDVDTGKVWNGKPVYRRQIANSHTANSATTILSGVDRILTMQGDCVVNGGATVPPSFYDGTQFTRYYTFDDKLVLAFAGFTSVQSYDVVVEYTKV